MLSGMNQPRLTVNREAVFKLIQQLCSQTIDQFSTDNTNVYSKRLVASCKEIVEYSEMAYELLTKMNHFAPNFDFDENTPGNGFRSLVCVCDTVVLHIISVLRSCSLTKSSIMFRVSFYCKEVENYMAVLRFWILASQQLIGSIPYDTNDSLFPPIDKEDYTPYFGVFKGIESLDASCFYSRPLGFQFCPSISKMFKVIGIFLATYSLSWEKGSGPIGSIINSAKFILSPEERASRIIKITREADLEFCKGFWNLPELGTYPKWMGSAMAICEVREIGSHGPLPLETKDGGRVYIPEPTAHTGFRPVKVRILSSVHRYHLSGVGIGNKQPLSPYLIVHCHGGGYVATSSKSHECYLRAWAKQSNIPIAAIDYSLAPENAYPRPTEEVLYSYAYMLNYPEKFGWTGEKICFVGDSAGGNLCTSVALRLIKLNVKRMPDGIVPIYTPYLFQYLPSPSRLLSFMDPLLHMGVLLRCLAAYTMGDVDANKLPHHAGIFTDSDKQQEQDVPPGNSNGHKSLLEYFDEVKNGQIGNIFKFDSSSDNVVAFYNISNIADQSEQITDSENQESDSGISNETIPIDDTQDMASATFIDDELDGSAFNRTQNVQVGGDPDSIVLSLENFDQSLVDFFKVNELTSMTVAPEAKQNGVHPKKTLTKSATTGFLSSISSTPFQSNEITVHESNNEDDPFNDSDHSVQMFNKQITAATRVSAGSISENNITGIRQALSVKGNEVNDNTIIPKKRTLSQSLAHTASMAANYAMDNITEWFESEKQPIGSGDKEKLSRAATMTPQMSAEIQLKEAECKRSNLDKLLKLKIPRLPEISPLYASDEELRNLPPMYFVACHLDPLLDDTIAFAKKVRLAGGPVKCVKLLDNLSHGFLNFTLVSPECKRGSDICLDLILKALNIPENNINL